MTPDGWDPGPQLAAFRARLSDAGLEQYADALAAHAAPSIRLVPTAADDGDVPLGASKLGGAPDLPHDAAWPAYNGVPMGFVIQVNLAETHGSDVERVLPDDGLLSLFYEAEQGVWGFDPADGAGWALLYTPAGAAIIRREPPDDLDKLHRFGVMRLAPRTELTFPDAASAEVHALQMAEDEYEAFFELLEEAETEPRHRLLGHPQHEQSDMRLECQLVTHGLYCGDETGYKDPRAVDLAPGAEDWRLLLQVDSQEDIDMMWGDAGRLYLWMTAQALADRDWNRAWFILQCG